MTATPKKKRRPGKPSKLDTINLEDIVKLGSFGLTDEELGRFFDVTESTINNWKKTCPAFFDALKKGKAVADDLVEMSVFRKIMGFTVTESEIIGKKTIHREPMLDNKGRIIKDGTKIVYRETEQVTPDRVVDKKRYVPGSDMLSIYWLNNRRPDKWKKGNQDVDTPELVKAMNSLEQGIRSIITHVDNKIKKKG